MLDRKSGPKKRTRPDDQSERTRSAPNGNGIRSFLNVNPEQQSSKSSLMGAKTLSSVTLAQPKLAEHHSIRLRIGIDDNAVHPGGVNIFSRGFGNHNHDILMRLHLK